MNNWEDEFSAYDIDIVNAQASRKGEGALSADELQLPEPEALESENLVSDLSVPSSERLEANDEDNTNVMNPKDQRQKTRENKSRYDQLLAKVGKRTTYVTKEDVEKAISQLEECIDFASQRPDTTPQDESTPSDKRRIKSQRIMAKQIVKATDVYVAARCVGRCYTDFDDAAYYKHLGEHQYLMQTSMAIRTFRERWPVVLKSETAQQAHDGVDKIMASAGRLAKSLAEVIDSFPGEGGMMKLLEMISQKSDDDEFSSVEHAIQMVAETQE